MKEELTERMKKALEETRNNTPEIPEQYKAKIMGLPQQ